MIEDILPSEVSAAEAFADLPGVTLFPEEEAVVARAVDKRRREFTTARGCARAALAGLGLPPVPIVPGLRGAPQWPAGVVGSMTHCAGYRAAAVARAQDVVTVGLDAEPAEPLPDGIRDIVTVAGERAWLDELSIARPAVCWDRLLFSAKESVYKAWFPLTRRWLDFQGAAITVDPDPDPAPDTGTASTLTAAAGTFYARLLVPGPTVGGRELTGFTGHWITGNGLVLTAIAVPAQGAYCAQGG